MGQYSSRLVRRLPGIFGRSALCIVEYGRRGVIRCKLPPVGVVKSRSDVVYEGVKPDGTG